MIQKAFSNFFFKGMRSYFKRSSFLTVGFSNPILDTRISVYLSVCPFVLRHAPGTPPGFLNRVSWRPVVKDSYPQIAKHKIYYLFLKQTFYLYFLDFLFFYILYIYIFLVFFFLYFDEEEKTEQNIVLFLNLDQ